jgi:hypothetical protein
LESCPDRATGFTAYREGGAAAFSAMGATRESIVEAAKEDYAEFIRDRSVVGPPGSSGAPDFETQLIDQSA